MPDLRTDWRLPLPDQSRFYVCEEVWEQICFGAFRGGKVLLVGPTNPNRWMIVVSDGAPTGDNYGGEPAIAATRDAVIYVRKLGIRVLNVAIEDYASEEIFGSSWVLKYTDLDEFVLQMKRLVMRRVRTSG